MTAHKVLIVKVVFRTNWVESEGERGRGWLGVDSVETTALGSLPLLSAEKFLASWLKEYSKSEWRLTSLA